MHVCMCVCPIVHVHHRTVQAVQVTCVECSKSAVQRKKFAHSD